MQKATIKDLESKGLKMITGVINNAYLRNGLINIIIGFDNGDDDIYIRVSNKELVRYHDCYLLYAINDALESVDKTDFVARAELLKKANEAIMSEFCDKTATVAMEELEPGATIHEIDGSVFENEATTDWVKYSLYEWK